MKIAIFATESFIINRFIIEIFVVEAPGGIPGAFLTKYLSQFLLLIPHLLHVLVCVYEFRLSP